MTSLVYLGILAFAVPIQKYFAKKKISKFIDISFVLISWFCVVFLGPKILNTNFLI